MAPWTTRILSPHSRNDHEANPAAGSSSASPLRPRVRITETDILENAYGIPTLPGPSGREGKNGHGRSMSHPFPSLFSNKKDKDMVKRKPNVGGFNSDDEGGISPSLAHHTAHNPTTKQVKVADKDLTQGPCMTCDSVVRWPKDLKVFRCTVCLTINDLRPVLLETKRGDAQRAPAKVKAGTYPESRCATPRIAPISIEKTRELIEQCIITYLHDILKHDDYDSDIFQSPQSLQGNDITEGRLFPKLSIDNREASQDTARSPPIHLSELPSDREDDPYISRHMIPPKSNHARSVPYSKSSPGDIFRSHMEQRGLQLQLAHGTGLMPKESYNEDTGRRTQDDSTQRHRTESTKNIFKPLEDYITRCFASFECINSSFSTVRPNVGTRTFSEGPRKSAFPKPNERLARTDETLSELDAKTLLLGDFAENGSWWTGERAEVRSPERSRIYRFTEPSSDNSVTLKSPQVDWARLNEWYYAVLHAGKPWQQKLHDLTASDISFLEPPIELDMDDIEDQILEAQARVQRVLLKATETLLKRPGRPLREPGDLRFLLIILSNPLLYPPRTSSEAKDRIRSRSKSRDTRSSPVKADKSYVRRENQSPSNVYSKTTRGSSGQHSGIIKRILGLLSGAPNDSHHYLVSWFARYSDNQFQRMTDLVGSFVTYRLTRQHGKKPAVSHDPTAGLVPSFNGHGHGTSAALHAALGVTGLSSKKRPENQQRVIYNDDWQIKAAARVMAILFAANNSGISRRNDTYPTAAFLDAERSVGLAARQRAHKHGQILPTSDFYNTLLDYSDLIADFENWEAKRSKFAFCQYPFFLSIWAKIRIMEHDARRQMEIKAREAFFESIMTSKNATQYLTLKVRRECLVEDSLRGVSEVVGSSSEDIKKGLRIEFKGEEGIDAGGLRKEWFLLLVREVFNPEHGMFSYDEDSRFCYFNPNSFETTDQYFLVGVVLGLAIYNSTILDVALPPFAFRKLLASAPATISGAPSHVKPTMTYSLEDLAEYRPSLAAGLRKLLDYQGDVETTFCRDFVADVERYGQSIQIPLCPDGENKPITNANRREFVDLYVRYLLDTAVARQFEPFKRGFFTVCGGNALSLFRPEEIELLIRGSEEPLDIESLEAVAKYENWGKDFNPEIEPVIQWFWQTFHNASSKDQRKLLSFITGSDRIPAMGATNLVIKILCLGPDSSRFPIARTCFNMISLYRYSSQDKLESILWRAVNESEGFGLK
ncbi:hypothetical protein B0O99DRAFT_691717 [Bisporella sp. PMI_857]|nr:hypothetical protein B0O99DRAFT_691717 [Bisporella sp. PMI_857]